MSDQQEYFDTYHFMYLRELHKFVGKTYYEDFNEVKILNMLGGVSGEPFFVCQYTWADDVFCADPMEVLVHFDDQGEPLAPLD